MNNAYVYIKDGASVCFDGHWMTWPSSYKHLKATCKIEGHIRKRSRMKLTAFIYEWYQGRERLRTVPVLAWFHDLRPLKDSI